jgi:hypothetical protein
MGHLGLQPQSVHQAGGYVKQATQPREADALVEDTIALQDAGARLLVLNRFPRKSPGHDRRVHPDDRQWRAGLRRADPGRHSRLFDGFVPHESLYANSPTRLSPQHGRT